MIMSKQLILGGYSDESALQAETPTVETLVQIIAAPRRMRARSVIRHVMRDISVERLASFGWSRDDIRRLKSV